MYGLKSDDGGGNQYFFLTPFLLITPITFFIYSQFNGIARIAAYISVFHEDEDDGLNWETRVKKYKAPTPLKKSQIVRSLGLMIFGVSLVCLLLTILDFSGDSSSIFKELHPIVYFIGVGFMLLVSYSVKLINDARKKYPLLYLESWTKLKQEEVEAKNESLKKSD